MIMEGIGTKRRIIDLVRRLWKPKDSVTIEYHQHDMLDYVQCQLPIDNLEESVKLPFGEDVKVWLAANICDFFTHVHLLYGTVDECCHQSSCPKMSAGANHTYLWVDEDERYKPINLPAQTYIDCSLIQIQKQLNDKELFPSLSGASFPVNFLEVVRKICFRLFQVYAHFYHHHFSDILDLNEEAHLNTSFKHFILFVKEFNLIEKEKLAPLQDLIDRLLKTETHEEGGKL